MLADRVNRIKPSATLAVSAKAAELKAAGADVISLSSGEPDFATPEHIKFKAKQAIDAGKTRYTAVDGIVELKQAVINKFKHDNKLEYTLDEVIVGNGGKQLIFNMFHAILNPKDEVIIPAPYWVSYPDIAYLAGAEARFIESSIEQNYKITAEQLEKTISAKSKILVLNSPSNPTGAMYDAHELLAIAEVLKKHQQILIASDDIYEKIILTADKKYVSILDVAPELKGRTIMLNGVSKAYAMTGWRIGFAAGPTDIIKAMKKIQSQSTSNPCSVAQYAALAALEGKQDFIKEMNLKFVQRNRFVVDQLNLLSGIKAKYADGAFYAFVDVRGLIKRMDNMDDDIQLCEFLLNKTKVAIVPGSAFGSPDYIRLSCATSMENLQTAIQRIRQVFS